MTKIPATSALLSCFLFLMKLSAALTPPMDFTNTTVAMDTSTTNVFSVDPLTTATPSINPLGPPSKQAQLMTTTEETLSGETATKVMAAFVKGDEKVDPVVGTATNEGIPSVESARKTNSTLEPPEKTPAPSETARMAAPPVDSTGRTPSPVVSETKIKARVDSAGEISPFKATLGKTKLSEESETITTPAAESANNTPPPVESVSKTLLPVESASKSKVPIESTSKNIIPVSHEKLVSRLDSLMESATTATSPTQLATTRTPPMEPTMTHSIEPASKGTRSVEAVRKIMTAVELAAISPPHESVMKRTPATETAEATLLSEATATYSTLPVDAAKEAIPAVDIPNKTSPPEDSAMTKSLQTESIGEAAPLQASATRTKNEPPAKDSSEKKLKKHRPYVLQPARFCLERIIQDPHCMWEEAFCTENEDGAYVWACNSDYAPEFLGLHNIPKDEL